MTNQRIRATLAILRIKRRELDRTIESIEEYREQSKVLQFIPRDRLAQLLDEQTAEPEQPRPPTLLAA